MTPSRTSQISRFENLNSDFVGRRRELSILDAALEEARAGLGSIFLLSGEAGIGKTLLVREFSAFARAGGAKVLEGRASLPFREVPFGVWKQILSNQVNDRDALQSVPFPSIESRASITAAVPPDSDGQDDPQLFETARALVEQARTQPLVLILDDLHVADPLSLRAFKVLGRELSRTGSMVIGVYRDSEIRRFQEFSDLLRDPLIRNSKQILLGAFDNLETREFVASRGAASLHEARLATLHALSGGNPRLLEIALRLHPLDETSLRAGESLGGAIRAEIEAHLENLSERARLVLSIASVAGVEFRLSSLFHVLESDSGELLDSLYEAEQSGLVKRTEVPGTYRFRPPMVQEILSAQLGGTRRARLHESFGKVLETLHPHEDAFIEPLARHFYEAALLGCADKAADYCGRAAAQARRESRFDDSLHFYHMALVALELSGSNTAAIRDLQERLEDLKSTREQLLPLNQFSMINQSIREATPNGANGNTEGVENPSGLAMVQGLLPASSEPTAGNFIGHSTNHPEDITASSDLATRPFPRSQENTFLREGDFWTLIFEGRILRLRHTNGLLFTAHLLRHPNRDFHVSQLVALLPSSEATDRPIYIPHGERQRLGMHAVTSMGSDPILDQTAKNEYRRRIEELNDGLGQAQAFHDAERAAELESEIQFIGHELARAVGAVGHDRLHRTEDQRARVNVTNAIRALTAKIAREHASLARYLRLSIRTGRFCAYRPDPDAPPRWRL